MVTLVNGTTFCLSTAAGEIVPGEAHGLFFHDARLLSIWSLLIDGHHPQSMSVDVRMADRARFVLRRRPSSGHVDSTVLVVQERTIGSGLVETITVDNMGRESTSFDLTIRFEADFADLFAVKEGRVPKTSTNASITSMDVTLHSAADPSRGIRLSASGQPDLATDSLTWHVVVPARQQWQTTITVQPIIGSERIDPQPIRTDAWLSRSTSISVADRSVDAVVQRSKLDLDALRMSDADGRAFLAAGAPWFMTLFGRDSLITAWMCLPLDVSVAVGTLELLASMQGSKDDPMTEEQPGRILHELRLGPDNAQAIGGREYYGTADATPLFVMLLGEAWRWGADPAVIRSLLPAADAGLAWIADQGDVDRDGFVEYRRATDRGLVNQGWKDSFDGINDAAGSLAEPPIALCEVQAYVYGALLSRAMLADAFGDAPTAARCRKRAEHLRAAFADAFWMPDHGWYAVGLDGRHRQVDALTSNVAHCLWTGIATDEHAAAIIAALSTPAMNSGYGLRTLAADMGAYNPMSYHNGSIWPHDTAIAIAGLMRYRHLSGATELAHALAIGLFSAASAFNGRLPELFCGFARKEFTPPIPYATSCSPQAWASAAPLLVLRSLLGLEPDEPGQRLRVQTCLPPQWGAVTLDGLRLGDVTTRVSADDRGVRVDGLPESWTVETDG
ncbi:MAG TPA: glycogen debranching N-terminal domain-containing protein [Micromonosporaceae bacterium]|jgi:glycogen debranching enzyme